MPDPITGTSNDSELPDPDFEASPDIAKEDEDSLDEKLPLDDDGYQQDDFYENLAEKLDGQAHDELLEEVLELYEIDKTAREKRDKQYEEGIKRTGVSNDAPGGANFQGASKVVHPGLAEASIDFCARTMKELFPSSGPVRIDIEGKLSKDKLDRAERKKRHMNWQFTKQIPEYRGVLENVLTQLPIGGAEFIKWYPDFLAKRPACEFVRVDNIHFPYNSNFYKAQRVFHSMLLSDFDVQQRVVSGLYLDSDANDTVSEPEQTKTQVQIDKAEGQEFPEDNVDGLAEYIDVYIFKELDTELDPEADSKLGPAPYIMTIDVQREKIVALYRNWEEDDDTQEKMNWIVKFGFLPWDGGLEIGLCHVAGSLSGAATGSFRALLDSALAQNMPTAIMLKGTAVTGGASNSLQPGQVTEIQNRNMPGVTNIRDLIQTIPYNQPSPVLLELLQYADGKLQGIIGSATEQAEDNQNMPVGTKLANIEQSMVVYSSIHQRLHGAQQICLEIVHRINRMYMEKGQKYDEELGFAVQEDYEGEIDVQPVSDPNIFAESQRYGQLQAVLQLIQVFPQARWDIDSIIKWALAIMRLPNMDEIYPDAKQPKDENPVAENIMMVSGIPAGVLPDQDHMAHLQVLLDFMTMIMGNPVLMQMMGQKYLPLAVVHAQQHIVYQYGTLMHDKVQGALGVPLAQIQDEDAEVSKKFSQLVATASPGVTAMLPNSIASALKVLGQAQQYVAQQAQQMQAMQMAPVQIDAARQQSDAQNQQQQNQIKSEQVKGEQQDKQLQSQIEARQIMADEQDAQLDAQTKIQTTVMDNQTALDIASMRAVTGGGKTGGLKDGTSLG